MTVDQPLIETFRGNLGLQAGEESDTCGAGPGKADPGASLAAADVELYVPDTSMPQAWIVDVDGTLALGRFGEPGRRGPFDWARVSEDDPHWPVIHMTRALANLGYRIIAMSGRSDACRDETARWLRTYLLVSPDVLLMRKDGDYRPDCVVKQELFDAHVRDTYYVRGVLDDRNQVVAMWRSMGLMCAQVNYGDF